MTFRCLFRRHQWHNGWDDFEHQTVWTCKRCGKERRGPVSYGSSRDQAYLPPTIGHGGDFGGGGGGGM
jgi:hypothetical protein